MIEVLLTWVVRVLFVIMIVRIAMRAFGGGARQMPRGWTRPGQGAAPRERVGGNLVQDPQCGTYVPVARAIQVGTGDRAQYFCSASCRDQYAARQRPVAS